MSETQHITDVRAQTYMRSSFQRRDAFVCVLLGLLSFAIYNANLRSITAADTYASRYLPFAIFWNKTVALDPIVDLVAQGRSLPVAGRDDHTAFWLIKGRENRFVSLYPIVVPVIIAPLYLPAIAYLAVTGIDTLRIENVARIMEKLCASLIASASVALLYLLLRRRSDPMLAALLSLVYAFGTTNWVISSQALWMHGLASLLIVGFLLLLTGPCTVRRAVLAGFVCGLIACNRQPDAILAGGLGIYALWWAGSKIPLFAVSALLPVCLVVGYNFWFVGRIAGAYAFAFNPTIWSDGIVSGVAGLLFSPTKGLFVFSPFLLFLLLYLPVIIRDSRDRGLKIAIGVAVVLQLLGYGIIDWRQGQSWGPRWLTDMLPMLFFLLPAALKTLKRPGRIGFGLTCCIAIAIEAVGAFSYTGAGDRAVYAAAGPDRMRASWDIRNAAFVADITNLPLPADLVVNLRGNIDIATVINDPAAKADRVIQIEGWALANSRTPIDVAVLIDGHMLGGTTVFFPRADVVQTLGEPAPSGWRITFPAASLSVGKHKVVALVRANAGGEPRLLAERTFDIFDHAIRHDKTLGDIAQQVVKVLADNQQSSGYWLTSHTETTRFEKPQQELNTFLNAVMVDLLDPVAETAGVAGMLQRTRDYLTGQIEADGLVRYHGRADAPTIGTLGCAITPDADDTALVWRVAPREQRDELKKARSILSEFQTPDGLYKTWLAPQSRYQCLDPGKDPNPPDLAIQMHVFMLLAQVDPVEAANLCNAIRLKTSNDDLRVYYTNAPLIPLYRLTDMRKAGCPLQLPQSHMQTDIAGQNIWIAAIQHLQSIEGRARTDAEHQNTVELLRKIASDNFSLLKNDPPLLYHNDLSATVRRFYWSPEFGYALWLRLYAQTVDK